MRCLRHEESRVWCVGRDASDIEYLSLDIGQRIMRFASTTDSSFTTLALL